MNKIRTGKVTGTNILEFIWEIPKIECWFAAKTCASPIFNFSTYKFSIIITYSNEYFYITLYHSKNFYLMINEIIFDFITQNFPVITNIHFDNKFLQVRKGNLNLDVAYKNINLELHLKIRLEKSLDDVLKQNKIFNFDTYKYLVNSEKFSDVKFQVQEKFIYAHKVILAAKSKFFDSMFQHCMVEEITSIIKIEDIDYEVLMEVIKYLYSAEEPNVKKYGEKLLISSDKYLIDELKTICEVGLCSNISDDNIFEYLLLSDRCNAKILKKACIKYIILNGENLISLISET